MKEAFNNWVDNLYPWFLEHGIRIIIIIIAGFILQKIMRKFVERVVRLAVVPDKYISREAEKMREDTLISIFNWAITIVIWIMVVMMIMQEFGIPIGPLIAGAGIIGLAFGFGGQYLIRDLISGFFIILENQYRIGDNIDVNGVGGNVEKISLRMTTLRDINGTVHHVPHGEITVVSNHSKDYARVNLDVGVSYSANIEKVIEIINRVGDELAEDPLWKSFIIKKPQFLRVNDLGDSAVVFKILGDTVPLQHWAVMGEMRKRLKIAFDKEGIEIPFPQMVIHQAK